MRPMIRKSAARFVASAGLVLLAASASAQHLRFTTGHRDIQIPEYATFRIGPFYSNVKLTESVGYRYTYGMEGRVTEQLGVRRGRIHDDGTEFPVISTLDFRNYLLITRWADADISFRAQYAYYPMNTQDDEFTFNVADEEISADINFEAYPTDYLRVRLGLAPKYVVDYVDLRGVEDDYGGQRYERFESYVELDIDWMLSRTENLGLSIDRTDIWPKDDEFKSQERTTHHGALLYERQVSPTATWGLGRRL
jgi:hypothetical protein